MTINYPRLTRALIGHLRYCCGGQSLQKGELFPIIPLLEYVFLQMRIRGKVNRRERDITKQTRAGPFVQAENTQLTNDMHSTSPRNALQSCSFSLHLQPDFSAKYSSVPPEHISADFLYLHNFQRICEDL